MTLDRGKGHAALRRGRFSKASAEYFLTLCTDGKRPGLATPEVSTAILGEMQAMAADGTWTLSCGVVMPDHLHMLIKPGERLPLEKAVQRLKAKTSADLRSERLAWERGFFDRLVRPNDDRLAVFRYIYLNPYRSALLAASDRYAHYYCHPEEWGWFRGLLHEERPVPEWLL